MQTNRSSGIPHRALVLCLVALVGGLLAVGRTTAHEGQSADAVDRPPRIGDTFNAAGRRISLDMPNLDINDKVSLTIEDLARTGKGYELRLLPLIGEGPSTVSLVRIYTALGEYYMSSDGTVDFDRLRKAESHFRTALRYPMPIEQRLFLTGQLSQVFDRRAFVDRGEPRDADRRENAQILWEGLQAARLAHLPAQPPTAPEPPPPIFDSSVAYSPPEKALQAEEQRIATGKMNAYLTTRSLIRSVQYRTAMESNLCDLYSHEPMALDEMNNLGMSIVGDKEYVGGIVNRAIDQYLVKYGEKLDAEAVKHALEQARLSSFHVGPEVPVPPGYHR